MTEIVDKTAVAMRLAAMNLLSRREHSRGELADKLADKFSDDTDLINPVLERLEEQGLQSDARFAEAFVSSRVRRGQGRQRIRVELRDRGVADSVIDGAFEAADVNWDDLAATVVHKRFGDMPPESYEERTKRMRFLQYRGFTADEIRAALE